MILKLAYRLYRGKWLITTEGRSAVIGHMCRDMWQRDTAAADGPGDAAAAALQTAACSCTPASLTHHCMQTGTVTKCGVDILVFNPQQLSPAPAVLIALSPICVPLLPSALTRPYPAITSLFNYHSATSELLCKPKPWKLQTAMNAELTRIWRCREGGQSSQVFDPNFYDPLCSTFNLIWKSIFSLKVAALSATLVLSCCGESGLKSEIKWRDQNNDKLFGFAKMIPSTILGLKIVQTATAAAAWRENEEF